MLRVSTCVCALALVAPAAASAATGPGTAPPGSSAVDQYRESAPPASNGSRKLDRQQRSRLAEQGQDGRDLAAALDRNGGVAAAPSGRAETDAQSGDADDGASGGAPGGGGSGTDGGGRGGSGSSTAPGSGTADPAATPREPGVSAESTVSSAFGTKVGPLSLWSVLVLVAAGALGVAVIRRRAA